MKYIITILITVIVCLVAYKAISFKPITKPTVTTTIIPGDSAPKKIIVKIPVPYDSIITVTDTFYRSVDTAEILRRYFTQYIYDDTIRDTSFVAIIKEIVTQNKIIDRKFYLQNLREKQIINYTTIIDDKKWFITANTELGKQTGIALGTLYENGKYAYGLGYDLINNKLQVSFNYRIK